MRNRVLAAGLVMAAMLLVGCDTSVVAPKTTVDIETPAPVEDAQVEETSAEEQVEEETEVFEEDEEVFRSLFSGERITYNKLDHRPLAVMLNNIKEGCPQHGIEKASIVYEAPVEGRITRLMGIFEDYESIPKIGSVRSSRDYYVYLALEYDAIYAHFGQATIYVGDMLNSAAVDNISGAVSGIERPATNAFIRTSDRKAPHNVFITNEGLQKDMEKFEYRTTLRTGFKTKFTYPELGDRVTYDNMPDATMLYPGGKETGKANGYSKVQSHFEYNPEDGKYYRFQYGDKHIDGESGEQLAYDNVIFQYCDGIVRDNNDYLAFGLIGEDVDKALVFTNGKMIEGTWNRTEIYEPTKYHDKDGNEIEVNTGKTWICIIWKDYADDVVVE